MKHQLLYLLSLGLTCGCTHDAEPSPADLVPPEGTPLEIAGVQMGGYAETRATYKPLPPTTPGPDENYIIGLYCQKADPSDTEQYNFPYSYSKYYDNTTGTMVWGEWGYNDLSYVLKLHGTDTDIYAYYPFKSGPYSTNDIVIKTQHDPSFGTSYSMGTISGTKQNEFTLKTCYYHPDFDICYGVSKKRNGTPSGKVATFQLDHIMAKFQLTLVRHKDYPGVCKIEEIELSHREQDDQPTVENFITQGTFDILTGTWKNLTKRAYTYPPDPTVNPNAPTVGPITISQTNEWDGTSDKLEAAKVNTRPLLLIPTKTGNGNSGTTELYVRIKVDGRKMQTMLPIKIYGGSIYSGRFYKATLIIRGTDIEVNSVKVADWNEQTIQNNGNDFEPKPAE